MGTFGPAREYRSHPHCLRPRRGWTCWLPVAHSGPCPAYPAWWNLRQAFRMWRAFR